MLKLLSRVLCVDGYFRAGTAAAADVQRVEIYFLTFFLFSYMLSFIFHSHTTLAHSPSKSSIQGLVWHREPEKKNTQHRVERKIHIKRTYCCLTGAELLLVTAEMTTKIIFCSFFHSLSLCVWIVCSPHPLYQLRIWSIICCLANNSHNSWEEKVGK